MASKKPPMQSAGNVQKKFSPRTYQICAKIMFIIGICSLLIGLIAIAAGGVLFLVLGGFCIWISRNWNKIAVKEEATAEFKSASTQRNASLKLWNMWDSSVHKSDGQPARMRRAMTEALAIKSTHPASDGSYPVVGSTGNLYTTSFCECSCVDYRMRGLPCKHMYLLAHQILGFDFSPYLNSNDDYPN